MSTMSVYFQLLEKLSPSFSSWYVVVLVKILCLLTCHFCLHHNTRTQIHSVFVVASPGSH
jgi:hypothetical protein